MVVVQATKLNLPNPSLSSSPHISSLLFEPHSLSLALMHSDSSFSLYPSLYPLSLSSLPPKPPTLIPPPSSSSTFLLLHQNQNQNPNPRVVFIVAGPHRGGAKVLLRFYILQKNQLFTRAQVLCSQKYLHFDQNLGVLVDANHGVSIRLSGSINFFTMYSVSSSKIWVFAVKLAGSADEDGGDDDGVVVKLMRCTVIDCCVPVWSISVSFGFLMLGEENGLRVFNLRSLAKGRARKVKNLNLDRKTEGRVLQLPNGVAGFRGSDDLCGSSEVRSKGGFAAPVGQSGGIEEGSKITCNVYMDGKIDKHYISVKQRSVKLRQDSGLGDSSFVAFKRKEVEGVRSTVMSVKAISIQALSPKKFLILDSAGDIHLMRVSNTLTGSNMTCHMRQLPHVMKVQKLAVLPDVSSRMQTVWVADGHHSLHTMVVFDADSAVDENERNEIEEKLVDVSVIQAIFASEKIQDVVPLTANAILILGQGSLFAYAIS